VRWLRAPVAWLVLVLLVAAGCASRGVPPIGADGSPFTPGDEERALWARAEQEAAALLRKVRLYDDALLEEYLSRIADRLAPDAVRAAGGPTFTIGVIRDPTLNAFALPNGRLYLHTGLLSCLENEAQLATILAHEMTHVTHRHALGVRRAVAGPPGAPSISVAPPGARGRVGDEAGAALIGPTASAIVGLRLALIAGAAIEGYGPDAEREADEGAIESLRRAGYDPREAPKVFELLRSQSGERGTVETFFFGGRAALAERIATTRELIRTRDAATAVAPVAIVDTEEFRLRMRPVVRDNAAEDIRAGRFALAQRQLDRVLAASPDDALAHVSYGDLHRLRAQRMRDAERRRQAAARALASYEKAVELDPALADPHRQLGLLYFQEQDSARAREAFERYLALKPDAPDAPRIREYLAELSR
jgi:predicted Zn-dependent protease